MSEADFWSTRPELEHVGLFARARQASPWAVLGVVLARAAATTPPTVVLPPTIGTTASLNLFVAVASRPGGGKGAAEGAARDAIAWTDSGDTIDVAEFPIGSGEGIARTFCHGSGDGEGIDRALFSAPEIDTLTALGSRTGATLMPELRKVFMSERLGFTNAQKTTRTMVQAHTYRACLVVGVQELRRGSLLADAGGGTPQRFLWLPAFDPNAPDTPPPCPELLTVPAPRWGPKPLVIPERALAEIRAHRTAVLRGQALHPLDGHRMLTRLKVAAALMVLSGRTIISVEDWQLANEVMRVSDETRSKVETALADHARRANRDRAVATADRDDIVSDRKVARTTEAILRWLDKAKGEMAANELRSKIKYDLRVYFGSAIAELIEDSRVVPIDVDRGRRYRLAQVHPVPGVQGATPQVSDRVRPVHPVPSDAPSRSHIRRGLSA